MGRLPPPYNCTTVGKDKHDDDDDDDDVFVLGVDDDDKDKVEKRPMVRCDDWLLLFFVLGCFVVVVVV